MEMDNELCLCFHVTKRKVVNYIRIEKPVRVAQLSDCYGAGTGCGWCRPFLKKLFEQAQTKSEVTADQEFLLTSGDYADARSRYIDEGHGTPPADAE